MNGNKIKGCVNMDNNYNDELSLLANILQVANFIMNVQEISNDEIMKMLEKQNTDYLEKLLLMLDKQNDEYFDKILSRLDDLENKINLIKEK